MFGSHSDEGCHRLKWHNNPYTMQGNHVQHCLRIRWRGRRPSCCEAEGGTQERASEGAGRRP